MPLGSYRGFSLELTFDRMSAAFEMRIVGEAEYKCELGGDAAGAVTRLDNAIAKMARRLTSAARASKKPAGRWRLRAPRPPNLFPTKAS